MSPPVKPRTLAEGGGHRQSDLRLTAQSLLSQGSQNSHLPLRVWILMQDPDSSAAARCYATLMMTLVWISVLATLSQTVRPPPLSGAAMVVLEATFDSIFLLETLTRLAVCPIPKHFFFNAYNLVDLAASVPLFMRASMGFAPLPQEDDDRFGVVCIILLHVVPVIRILKTLRTFRKFHLIHSAFVLAFEALPVLLFTLVVIVILFSSLIYWAEPRSNIATLPTAMYFTIITMTTVGYGDISPTTDHGHVAVSLCTVAGVLYMAMPIGIVGSAFNETWQRRDRILLIQRIRENFLQWGHSAVDIPALFDMFDRTGSGELCFREFRRFMKFMRIGLPEDRILELFQSMDQDRGGTIDADEFARLLFPQSLYSMHYAGTVHLKALNWGEWIGSMISALFERKEGPWAEEPTWDEDGAASGTKSEETSGQRATECGNRRKVLV